MTPVQFWLHVEFGILHPGVSCGIGKEQVQEMRYIIGFVIALFIALTGVGAGTVTVPILVLFLGVPAPIAVGIGLMFATAVKLVLGSGANPAAKRGLADLGFHASGRGAWRNCRVAVPKTSCGLWIAISVECIARRNPVTTAGWQIIYFFRKKVRDNNLRDRSPWLPWLMFRWAPRLASHRLGLAH